MKTQATPPTATVMRATSASVWTSMLSELAKLASMSAHRLRTAGLGGVERGRQAMLFAVVAGTLPEARPADAGRTMAADQAAVRVLAQHLKDEHVLGDDDIAFHAHHLGDVGDAARAVAQARGLDDHVHRGA